MAYVIAKVDGSGTGLRYGEWVLLAEWNPDVFDAIVKPALAAHNYEDQPWFVASILWERQRRADLAKSK